MSRRGKDEGFHPHPGDPWHPGWSSEAEAVPTEEQPAALPEIAPVGVAPGAEVLEEAAEAVAPPPVEEAPAGPRPAVVETPPAGRIAEEVSPSLFGWAEAAPPPVPAPAEPEHLRPPWAPEGGGEPAPVSVAAPAGALPAAEAVPEEPPAAPLAEGEEAEVAEWLAFAVETDAAASMPAEEPGAGVEMIPGAAEAPPIAARRRRFWPFGRRRRPAEEPASEGPGEEEAPTGEVGAPGEVRLPLPPPWLPEEGAEGATLAAEGEAQFGEEAAAGEAAEEPAPPPWVPQAELDRAAAIPVIPALRPVEEPPAAPGEGEWPSEAEAEGWEEAPALPDGGRTAAAVAATTLEEQLAPEGEEAEEWEEFPEPGRPVGPGARGIGPAAGEGRPAAAGPHWERVEPGERAPETAGAPTMEMPPPAPVDYLPRARPGGPISEEVLSGAVTTEHLDLAEEVAAADTSEAQLQALSAPMAGLESGVVGFEDVVHLGEEAEAIEPTRSDLPIRVATGMVLVGILLGALWVGGEFLAGFIGLLAVLGLGELYGTLRRSGYQPLALFGFLGAIGLLVGTWFYGLVAIPVAAIALTVVCFFYYTFASRRRDPLTNGSLTLLGMLWVAGTLAFAFPIAAAPDFRVLVLALAATVVATDVGAYFAGRSWGSRPLAPVLSPHKTVEGLAGGVVLGIGAAVAIGYFLEPLNLRIGAGLGLVVAVVAPLGDLAESMVKRSLGVKDMGSILPGHGGILDRLDAFLFVVPAAWVLYETLGLLR